MRQSIICVIKITLRHTAITFIFITFKLVLTTNFPSKYLSHFDVFEIFSAWGVVCVGYST